MPNLSTLSSPFEITGQNVHVEHAGDTAHLPNLQRIVVRRLILFVGRG